MKFLWSGNLLQRYVFFAFVLIFWTWTTSSQKYLVFDFVLFFSINRFLKYACLPQREKHEEKAMGGAMLLLANIMWLWKRRTWRLEYSFGRSLHNKECWNSIPYLCFFVWSLPIDIQVAKGGLLNLSYLSIGRFNVNLQHSVWKYI